MTKSHILTYTRIWLILFSTGLVLSGLTAIFTREGLRMLNPLFTQGSIMQIYWPSMAEWLSRVYLAVEETYDKYPFLSYGNDWLAFGHFIIAIPFLMTIRDPNRYPWVITYGIIACLAVIPFAIVFGTFRGIPPFWIGIDTLFGIGGLFVLLILRGQFKKMNFLGE